MNTPQVFVICNDNCKFEGMTKEQILTAITQAVEFGKIGNVDTGFITTIKTITGTPLQFFVGKQAAYEKLTTEQRHNLFAIITDDVTKENIEKALSDLDKRLTSWEQAFDVSCLMRNKNEEMHNPGHSGIQIFAPTEGLFIVPTWKSNGHNICFGLVYWDGKTTTSTAVTRLYNYGGAYYRYLITIYPTGETVASPRGGYYNKGWLKVEQINDNTLEKTTITVPDTEIEVRYITNYYYDYGTEE